jgi:hypothetical protein
MNRYGIGADVVSKLIGVQGGGCAICGRRNPEHVDHCHETGVIRGVLCFNCNGGLGQFKDDIASLRRAIEYLEQAASQERFISPLVRRRTKADPGLFDG